MSSVVIIDVITLVSEVLRFENTRALDLREHAKVLACLWSSDVSYGFQFCPLPGRRLSFHDYVDADTSHSQGSWEIREHHHGTLGFCHSLPVKCFWSWERQFPTSWGPPENKPHWMGKGCVVCRLHRRKSFLSLAPYSNRRTFPAFNLCSSLLWRVGKTGALSHVPSQDCAPSFRSLVCHGTQ